MPVPKDILNTAVQAAESRIPIYPTRFPNIEAAKIYVASLCALDLRTELDNKTAYHVALRAFYNGEFYMDEPPRDRLVLWNAIESGINVLLPQLRGIVWPHDFTHVGEVKMFIAKACRCVENMTFAGVAADVFQGYVLFHTARRVWEQRGYEVVRVPKGWKRAGLRVQTSLSDVVEADIVRLMPLMQTWSPCYADLNEARDHVRHVCERNRFRYTFHPEVEDGKFRTIVQFNTAKYALRDGKFKVSEEGEWKRLGGRGRSDMTAPMRSPESHTPASLDSQDTLVEEGVDRLKIITKPYGTRPTSIEPSNFAEFKNRASVPVHTPAVDRAESVTPLLLENHTGDSTTTSADITEAELVAAEEEKVESISKQKVDPFQSLVADIRRELILKAAFD